MEETYDVQEKRPISTQNSEKQHPGGLKIITWIMAYAVWIFIFLIPIIGIVLIVMFLLKNNKPQAQDK